MQIAKTQAGISQQWRKISTDEDTQTMLLILRSKYPPVRNMQETFCFADYQTDALGDA